MLQMKKISETYGMKVYTESGDFFGTVEEVIITHSGIHGWKVVAEKNSGLSRLLGNVKGVIVPHKLIKAIQDIMIVYDNVFPSNKQGED
ncbi:MAG: PRC-barrel domain-containing protein [Nanoarchaeota archaeon]|nr:PRC-barrel domain-containing protein [Nanoarchaeota archaeon]